MRTLVCGAHVKILAHTRCGYSAYCRGNITAIDCGMCANVSVSACALVCVQIFELRRGCRRESSLQYVCECQCKRVRACVLFLCDEVQLFALRQVCMHACV